MDSFLLSHWGSQHKDCGGPLIHPVRQSHTTLSLKGQIKNLIFQASLETCEQVSKCLHLPVFGCGILIKDWGSKLGCFLWSDTDYSSHLTPWSSHSAHVSWMLAFYSKNAHPLELACGQPPLINSHWGWYRFCKITATSKFLLPCLLCTAHKFSPSVL